MAEDHQQQRQQQQQQQPQPPPPLPPQIPSSQAALSSVRLQHFNYLTPNGQPAQPPPQPQQHFPVTVGPGPEGRHYSFDTDTESQRYPLSALSAVDYDQTEGLGGVSVSSYDSIDDDRIDPAMRGYTYHGEKHINYHAPEHDVSYITNSLYPSHSYTIEDAGGFAQRGDRTPSDISSSISPPNGQVGNNKFSTIPPGERLARALSVEEQNRLVIEEDKRRRNTAASARFRVKKKQREQALERAVHEATEAKSSLEVRVTQLEMENRWLKNLLTEKNENLLSRLAALQPSDMEKLEQSSNPAPSSTLSPSLTPQPKKSDSTSGAATTKKPIMPKPTVGVGTEETENQ